MKATSGYCWSAVRIRVNRPRFGRLVLLVLHHDIELSDVLFFRLARELILVAAADTREDRPHFRIRA